MLEVERAAACPCVALQLFCLLVLCCTAIAIVSVSVN